MSLKALRIDTDEGIALLSKLGILAEQKTSSAVATIAVDRCHLLADGIDVGDGPLTRPSLIVNGKVTGLSLTGEDDDQLHFDGDDRGDVKYRYELSDAEIIGLIEQGLYRKDDIESLLSSSLRGYEFDCDAVVDYYKGRLSDGVIDVPYYVAGDFVSRLDSKVSHREGNRQFTSFGVIYQNALQLMAEADGRRVEGHLTTDRDLTGDVMAMDRLRVEREVSQPLEDSSREEVKPAGRKVDLAREQAKRERYAKQNEASAEVGFDDPNF